MPQEKSKNTRDAIFGAWVICSIAPAIIFTFYNLFRMGFVGPPLLFIFIVITAAILTGPGILILGNILLAILRHAPSLKKKSTKLCTLIASGAVFGAITSIANIPGYLGAIYLERDSNPIPRLAVVFVVTGALCGTWIAWQVFKERHPGHGFLPEISDRMRAALVVSLLILGVIFFPTTR